MENILKEEVEGEIGTEKAGEIFHPNNDITPIMKNEDILQNSIEKESNIAETVISEEPIIPNTTNVQLLDTEAVGRLDINEENVNFRNDQHEDQGNAQPNLNAIDEELYRHNLSNLVENLNNLRDILQNIVSNSGLQQLNNMGHDQNPGLQPDGNQNIPVDEQLQNLRRLLMNNQQLNDNNIENNDNVINMNAEDYFIRFRNYMSQKIKDFRFLLTLFGISSFFLLLIGYSISPNLEDKQSGYIINWLVNNKNSTVFLIGAGLTNLTIILKFLEFLYSYFLPEDGNISFKLIFESLMKYSPFYDLGLYLLIDNSIVENKFDFGFVFAVLAWDLVSSKVSCIAFDKLSKIMFSITHSPEKEHAKMKKIQQFGALILILNLQVSVFVLWICWYANFKIIIALGLISALSILDPIKLFLSSSISLKNYSLITNNNVIHLNDPKFKTETIIDIIYQSLIMSVLILIGYSSSKYIMGFIIIYFSSFYNSITKLRDALRKIQKWRIINNKLDEIYPVVDRKGEADEEICTICHENMLIARKLPCGHIFHA